MASCAYKCADVSEYVERLLLTVFLDRQAARMAMREKERRQICPEIHYRKAKDGVVITGCYGTEGKVILPDEIDGMEVKGIGDYAFAKDRGEEGEALVYTDTRHGVCHSPFTGSIKGRIGGGMVEEVHLPARVTEIGRYAFYRCKNLKKLTLADSLLEIGGGAFTGCRLSEVEIHFQEGEQSCLKSILDEIRFEVRVKLRYSSSGSAVKEQEARLLFPEHHEEAVENTPARILFTQHHGAGGYYRQCFYDRKLDFKKYDELFFHTVAQEKPEIAAELALDRLRCPFRLAEGAQEAYGTYVREHLEDAADFLIGHEDVEGIRFLSSKGYWTEAALGYAVDAASKRKETEILSVLMDEKHRRYPARKKKFEL